MKKYRLRYAPSPTGFLHIGNTRTALMNYLFAKHHDGDFIVRIEDTDLERNVDGAIDSQFDNLKWLGIIPDESFLNPKEVYGEYMQSRKFQIYKDMAMKLVNEGKAYKCYCNPEQLELERNRQLENGILAPKYAGTCRTLKNDENDKAYNIRFKVPENKIYKINDLVRGLVEFDSKEIGDFVILKTNGIATYNFAVVVDDYDMKISHVVRGEEHISNTPRQCMIYEAFNWDMPVFCHLTLIVDDTKKKLSKRSGNSLFFISQYREKGYLPEAIFNYISLLGWSPSGEQEIFERNELINIFDEKRFSKSPSTFDVIKLKWINSQWMKKLTEEEYLSFTKKFIDKEKFDIDSKNESWLNDVLLLFKKELEFGAQINAHLNMFFNSQHINKEILKQLSDFNDYKIMIHDFKEKVKCLVTFDENEIKLLIKDMGIKHNRKGKDLFMPLRICSTLSEHGPELAKTIMLIGRDNVIKNIESLV